MGGRATLLFAIVCAGCTAPDVIGRYPDGADTAVADVAEEAEAAPKCLHDEDGDGYCDDDDTCPTIANPEQELERKVDLGFTKIGSACAPGGDFGAARTRLFWDPFTELTSRWQTSGPLPNGAFHSFPDTNPDSLIGGVFSPTDPIAILRTSASPLGLSQTVVVTAVFQKPYGGGPDTPWGIFIGGGSPLRFLSCNFIPSGSSTSLDSYAISVVEESGCTDSRCPLKPLATSQRPDFLVPPPGPETRPIVGIRLAVTPYMGKTLVECRIFDPRIPTTLTSGGVKRGFLIRELDTATLPLGPNLGVFADRVIANITSIDVVVGR